MIETLKRFDEMMKAFSYSSNSCAEDAREIVRLAKEITEANIPLCLAIKFVDTLSRANTLAKFA